MDCKIICLAGFLLMPYAPSVHGTCPTNVCSLQGPVTASNCATTYSDPEQLILYRNCCIRGFAVDICGILIQCPDFNELVPERLGNHYNLSVLAGLPSDDCDCEAIDCYDSYDDPTKECVACP